MTPPITALKTLTRLFACISLFAIAFVAKGADAGAPAAPEKILMVGNSLTYIYGIPSILEHLAAANNRKLTVTAHVAGGKDLTWHWTNANVAGGSTAGEVIAKGGFDLVILQEYSNNLAKKESADTFDQILTEYLKVSKAASEPVMLYMAHPTAKEVDPALLAPIIDAYTKEADKAGLVCAPVAVAFERCNEKLPGVAFTDRQTDRKYAMNKYATHQSPFGAYLAACVLYSAIYKQSPVGLNFHAAFDAKQEIPIDAADAAVAQEVAWQVWQEWAAKHNGRKSG